jgi:dTDP-4-amino-4,6-dideoxygalactose transaminase
MQVPMLDLKAQYASLREETVAAVNAVLESQYLCNGPAVADLEKELASYCNCAEAIGVSSGTDALLVSLMALGIGAGDEVITTPFTFFATAGCIWRTGARPVFVDIEPDTFNIDPSRIEAAITDKTRAILPVHLFGQVAEMDPIMEIASRRGLAVVEDAAQSIGAKYRGRDACSIGTLGCLSFYPTKNLGALGDAGMVLTNDAELAAKVRMLRNHGQGSTYIHHRVGGNFRMDSICGAGLAVKLPHLNDWSEARRAHAAIYDEEFASLDPVTAPVIREHNHSIFNQYVVRVPRRDELRAFLGKNEIGSGIYYPLSLHQHASVALPWLRRETHTSRISSLSVTIIPPSPVVICLFG